VGASDRLTECPVVAGAVRADDGGAGERGVRLAPADPDRPGGPMAL